MKISEYKYDATASGTPKQDFWIIFDYDDMDRLTDTWWYDYNDTTIIKHAASDYYG